MSLPNTQKKLEGIQILRAVAALLVLWSHMKYDLGLSKESLTGQPWLATNLGAIGVDIFFVISGFVIAMTGSKLEYDWRAFISSRVARIVPLYFALSAYSLVEAVISVKVHGGAMPFSWRQIFNTFAFIPLFNGREFIGPILVNGWTLSFEIWFYFCFACIMRYSGGALAGIRLPCLLAVAVVAKILLMPTIGCGLLNFLFHPITLEFCAGCLLFYYRNSIGKGIFYMMGVACPVLLYFAQRTQDLGVHWSILNNPVLGMDRTFIWGGFTICLVGIFTHIDLDYQVRWPKWLVSLGDASYSIYLIPGSLLMTSAILWHGLSSLIGRQIVALPPLTCGILFVAGTIICSMLSRKYFEVPAGRMLKTFLMRFFANRPGANKSVDATIPA
jgi:hypothetical protein